MAAFNYTNLKPSFLLRADSGAGIGFGHRTRIEAIAKVLKKAKFNYRIISKRKPGARLDIPELNPTLWLRNDKTKVAQKLLEIKDAEETIKVIKRHKFFPSIVLVDSYFLGVRWEKRMQNEGFYVVSLDDFNGKPHASNLVIELLPPDRKTYRTCGLEYIPVDKKFEGESIRFKNSKWNVLVSFGGEDPTNHTRKAVEALTRLIQQRPKLIEKVNIVLGSQKKTQLNKLLNQNILKKFVFHHQLPSLGPMMKSSDLILTSAGNTMIESLVAKRLSLIIITARNQKKMAEFLNSQNLIYLLGEAKKVSIKKIKNSLLCVVNKMKNGMQHAIATNKFDSNGSFRIVETILNKWKNNT